MTQKFSLGSLSLADGTVFKSKLRLFDLPIEIHVNILKYLRVTDVAPLCKAFPMFREILGQYPAIFKEFSCEDVWPETIADHDFIRATWFGNYAAQIKSILFDLYCRDGDLPVICEQYLSSLLPVLAELAIRSDGTLVEIAWALVRPPWAQYDIKETIVNRFTQGKVKHPKMFYFLGKIGHAKQVLTASNVPTEQTLTYLAMAAQEGFYLADLMYRILANTNDIPFKDHYRVSKTPLLTSFHRLSTMANYGQLCYFTTELAKKILAAQANNERFTTDLAPYLKTSVTWANYLIFPNPNTEQYCSRRNREDVLGWTLRVCCKMRYPPRTVFEVFDMIDYCIAHRRYPNTRLWRVASAALVLTSRLSYSFTDNLTLRDAARFTRIACTPEQMVREFAEVCGLMKNFKQTFTGIDLLDILCLLGECTVEERSRLCMFYTIGRMQITFLKLPAWQVAGAALCLTMLLMGRDPWPPTLTEVTQITYHEIHYVAYQLYRTLEMTMLISLPPDLHSKLSLFKEPDRAAIVASGRHSLIKVPQYRPCPFQAVRQYYSADTYQEVGKQWIMTSELVLSKLLSRTEEFPVLVWRKGMSPWMIQHVPRQLSHTFKNISKLPDKTVALCRDQVERFLVHLSSIEAAYVLRCYLNMLAGQAVPPYPSSLMHQCLVNFVAHFLDASYVFTEQDTYLVESFKDYHYLPSGRSTDERYEFVADLHVFEAFHLTRADPTPSPVDDHLWVFDYRSPQDFACVRLRWDRLDEAVQEERQQPYWTSHTELLVREPFGLQHEFILGKKYRVFAEESPLVVLEQMSREMALAGFAEMKQYEDVVLGAQSEQECACGHAGHRPEGSLDK